MKYSDHTSLFMRQVRDFISPLPPLVDVDSSCLAVVDRMRQEKALRVLVRNAEGRIVGIFSTSDLLHRVAFDAEASIPVSQVMTRPVHTVREDLPLFRAVATMRHQGLQHLPVVDIQDRPRGMLLMGNILAPLLGNQLSLVESIAHDHSPEDLRHVKESQFALTAALLEQRVPPPDILTVLTRLNDEIYRRILELSIDEMVTEGWGEPPVAFAAVVTGSGGRRESSLHPDQDNGLILEDYPEELYPQVNDYFFELGVRMTQKLDAAGIRLCIGYVMATNHSWRKRLFEWKLQLLNWLRWPSVASTVLLDIWIDFRCVFGDARLAQALRDYATETIPHHHGFLRELEVQQLNHDIAVTPFRTLKKEHQPGKEGHRKVDIKRKGLRPLLEGVRILALRDGIDATETMGRLAALRARETLSEDLTEILTDAFMFLTEMLLRQQLEDHREGRPPGVYVAPKALTHRDRKRLKDSLQAVARLRSMVHMEFSGELF